RVASRCVHGACMSVVLPKENCPLATWPYILPIPPGIFLRSPVRQEKLRLADLLAFAFRRLSKVQQFAVVVRGLASEPRQFGRACGAKNPVEAIRVGAQRSLVLCQRLTGLTDRHEQVSHQFSRWQ